MGPRAAKSNAFLSQHFLPVPYFPFPMQRELSAELWSSKMSFAFHLHWPLKWAKQGEKERRRSHSTSIRPFLFLLHNLTSQTSPPFFQSTSQEQEEEESLNKHTESQPVSQLVSHPSKQRKKTRKDAKASSPKKRVSVSWQSFTQSEAINVHPNSTRSKRSFAHSLH
jgi:hypothetical protein